MVSTLQVSNQDELGDKTTEPVLSQLSCDLCCRQLVQIQMLGSWQCHLMQSHDSLLMMSHLRHDMCSDTLVMVSDV